MPTKGNHAMRHASHPITYRDACVLVFLALLVPAAFLVLAQRSREQAHRVKCASNLRRIGQSIQIYANDNKGAFPRTIFGTDDPNPVPTEYTGVDATDPFGPGGPASNDTTAPLYLLLRVGDIGPEVFICPSTEKIWDVSPWPRAPKSASNFTSRSHLTYGYTNPYPSQAARMMGFKLNYTLSSDFAIAADMGAAAPAAMQTAANAPRAQMVKANSPNHAGDGQNVLYADCHVDWATTIFAGSPRPVVGAPRDNVYAFGVDTTQTAPSAGIRGAPVDQYDTVILPAVDIGPQPAAAVLSLMEQPGLLLLIVGIAVLVIMAVVAVVVVKMTRGKQSGSPPPLPPGGPGGGR